ncbi:MAG: DUF2442 domain-containing protein [Gemmatimonadales bacterium]
MGARRMTNDEILQQIPAARARAARVLSTQPRAKRVVFPVGSRAIELQLTNGVSLRIPLALLPPLRNATTAELAELELDRFGLTLHWESLDADYGVGQLVTIALGQQTVLRASASVAGATKSPAKSAAARANGRKGGRPRKVAR